jgi:hypothetical protein
MTLNKASVAGYISGYIKLIDPAGILIAIIFLSSGLYALMAAQTGWQGLVVMVAGMGSILYSLMHVAIWKD